MIINLSRIDFGGVATGGKAKPEEVFDVQPTTSDQTITPTEGSVFSGGTVRAVTSDIDVNIVSNNIKEGVTILGVAGTLKEEKPEETFNVQPTTAEQTITPTPGSVFSRGTVRAVTSSIDSNIQPENIKQGVSILGVAGTLSEGITPAGTIAINLNGTYDVTNYASAEVNVGDTPDYRYAKGTVDKAGLKAIGWTDEDILTYEQNTPPHYTWQNDQFKVSEENKALYLLDNLDPSTYKDNSNIEYVPKKNMESYFAKPNGFQEMKYIKGIPFYDTSNMTDATYLFQGCSNLLTIPQLDTSNMTNISTMFSGCTNLTSIPQLDTSNAIYMSYTFSACRSLLTIPLLNTSNVTNMMSMFTECSKLTTIPQMDTSKVTNMSYMFKGCPKLTTIPQMDTSKVTNMSYMFSDCTGLTTVPSLDTSSVTKAEYMFQGCSSLTTVPSLDLSSARYVNNLFAGCSSLTTVPSLDLSSTTQIKYLFAGCSSLTTVPSLDLSNIIYASSLFSGCSSLITVPPLNTSRVADMAYIFGGCKSLTTVEGIDFSGSSGSIMLFDYKQNLPKLTRFIVNGKINVSNWTNYSFDLLTAIDYDSVKSILAAADRTDNTNAKELAFNRTMTDQNGELAALVSSCTTKGWTITGLTLQ